MKTRLFGAVTLACCLFFATVATAGTFTYDAALSDGVYYGSGNSNTAFTVFTSDNNLELGLGAIVRYQGPAPETGDTYYVPVGPTTASNRSGPAWGFRFSVNAQAGGGSAVLTDYNYMLTITNITANGSNYSFSPLLLPDNTFYDSTGATATNSDGAWGFQNSESPFFFSGANSSFDMNLADTYNIELSAYSKNSPSVTSSVSINAVGTPEPATFGLIGLALSGLGLVGSRRRHQGK